MKDSASLASLNDSIVSSTQATPGTRPRAAAQTPYEKPLHKRVSYWDNLEKTALEEDVFDNILKIKGILAEAIEHIDADEKNIPIVQAYGYAIDHVMHQNQTMSMDTLKHDVSRVYGKEIGEKIDAEISDSLDGMDPSDMHRMYLCDHLETLRKKYGTANIVAGNMRFESGRTFHAFLDSCDYAANRQAPITTKILLEALTPIPGKDEPCLHLCRAGIGNLAPEEFIHASPDNAGDFLKGTRKNNECHDLYMKNGKTDPPPKFPQLFFGLGEGKAIAAFSDVYKLSCGSGPTQSLTEGLIHELVHYLDYKNEFEAFSERIATHDKTSCVSEAERISMKYEVISAKELGESPRESYLCPAKTELRLMDSMEDTRGRVAPWADGVYLPMQCSEKPDGFTQPPLELGTQTYEHIPTNVAFMPETSPRQQAPTHPIRPLIGGSERTSFSPDMPGAVALTFAAGVLLARGAHALLRYFLEETANEAVPPLVKERVFHRGENGDWEADQKREQRFPKGGVLKEHPNDDAWALFTPTGEKKAQLCIRVRTMQGELEPPRGVTSEEFLEKSTSAEGFSVADIAFKGQKIIYPKLPSQQGAGQAKTTHSR